MPLACGNSVIFKASELCPGTHALIGTILHEAGLPAGTINVLHNAPENAAQLVGALIAHPAVRRVNFTGSTHVGRIIGASAARHLKPALLELGGKAPCVIFEDADLDAAVDGAAFGAFMNQGQICMSTERIVVDEAIADAFVARLAAKARGLAAAIPGTPGAVLGSLVSTQAAERIAMLVEDAVAQGATLLCGGTHEGPVMQATILDHVTPAMRIYAEESFGPVVSILRGRGEEELVRLANDTEFGLSAALFTRDVKRAVRVAGAIRSGICHVNGPTVHDEAQMPFGGVRDSGYGRFGGKAGIAEFTDLRWITFEDEQHYPF
jgi:acyl-CoA reductase-like NAD-dependent aldehyde dehydrogenase